MTAELVIDAEIVEGREAEVIDAELRAAARTADSAWMNVEQLVAEAEAGGIHAELGFASWPAYVADVVAQELPNISRQVEQRRWVVEMLTEAGMSNRAIAQAVGVTEITVRRDREQVRHDVAPEAGPVEPTGLDEFASAPADSVRRTTVIESGAAFVAPGQEIPVDRRTTIDRDTGEVLPEEAQCIHCGETLPLAELYEGGQGYECDPCVSPDEPEQPAPAAPPVPPATVTGLDGKNYPAQTAPKEPRRKPLVDVARDLGLDIAKLSKRIEEFGADDRLVRNKNEVAPRLRHHLDYVIQVCQDLNHQLAQEV